MCGKMKGRQSVSFADAGAEKETAKKEAPYGSLKSEMMNDSQPVMAVVVSDLLPGFFDGVIAGLEDAPRLKFSFLT